MNTTNDEIWKEIANYENYMVSYLGRVKNCKKNKVLNPCKNSKGYYTITLYNNNHPSIYKVSRLVAKAFIPNDHNFPDVDHIDRDKQNNLVENLRWATKSQNQANKNILSRNTTGYIGVSFHKMKYRADIKLDQKQYYLGSYETKEEAAIIYNFFAKVLHKEFAVLNKTPGIIKTNELVEKIQKLVQYYDIKV